MYQVFTDGSSSRKRGTIGVSYVIFENKDYISSFSKGFIDKQARNGLAELLGVYYFLYDICLNNIFLNKDKIIIYSDSQYVVKEFTEWFRNQMIKNFFNTKNVEIIIYILWMLDILRKEGYRIIFKWIKGHQKEDTFETYGNNYADKLAVEKCHYDDILNMRDIEEYIKELKFDIKAEGTLEVIKKNYLNI